MQKTSRLVVLSRGALLGLLAVCFSMVLRPGGDARAAQENVPAIEKAQGVSPSSADQWGESAPPKGFVQSKEPAKGKHTYNWTQMAYGGVVIVLMGLFLVWLVRNNQLEEKVEE